MPEDTVRTFVAIPVEPLLLDQIQQLQRQMHDRINGDWVRWCPKEQLHLTLRFLGGLPADRVEAVGDAIRKACEGTGPLHLCVEGVGCFPTFDRPNVIWVGITGDLQPLAVLKCRLDREVDPLVDRRDDHPFHPHLTIGRIRNIAPRDRRAAGEAVRSIAAGRVGEWPVNQVNLVRSDLSAEGARYACLRAVQLPVFKKIVAGAAASGDTTG